jgi:hypothetical protein
MSRNDWYGRKPALRQSESAAGRGAAGRSLFKRGAWLIAVLSLGLVAALNARAYAQIDGNDVDVIADRPAATLLLPYFQVNLKNPNAATTLFSIVNASADAELAHVVIWSDLSVHVLDFDVYLTGYGLYRINLSNLLINGTSPETGFGTSPVGPISGNSQFPGCSGILPLPNLSSTQLTAVQNALQGLPSSELGNDCAGVQYGDGIMRGYITIDDVNQCSFLFPGQPGYTSTQDEQSRVITDNNVLWGDVFYINPTTNRATAMPLVHIIAEPETFSSGQYTFYGRYDSVPWNTEDDRQPLPTTFLSRYINPGSPEATQYFNQGSAAIVWRDSKVNQPPFTCPAANENPNWYGLGQEGIATFDEQEDVETPPVCHFSPCPPNVQAGFPAETQKFALDSTQFPITFGAGWLWLDLNHAGGATGLDDPNEAISWVFTAYDGTNTGPSSANTWEINERAVQLDTGTNPNHCTPNDPDGTTCPVPVPSDDPK